MRGFKRGRVKERLDLASLADLAQIRLSEKPLLTSLFRTGRYQELQLHHFMRKGAEPHGGVKEVTAGKEEYFIRAWHWAKWYEVRIPRLIQ